MREELTKFVYPVFDYAATLYDRLHAGDKLSLDVEQAALRDLLAPVQRFTPQAAAPIRADDELTPPDAPGPDYRGVHYALVCWLDELFILDSPWSGEWNERKLETALYASNDRAWRFWDQADLAERKEGLDAVEVFFLCVQLGFRGNRVEEPDALRAWVNATRIVLLQRLDQPWDAPPEREPPAVVPPRFGRQGLQRMALVAGVILMLSVPLVLFLITRALSG
jgi:type VI secretion system protein ImpK